MDSSESFDLQSSVVCILYNYVIHTIQHVGWYAFFPKYFILQYKKRPGITKLKFQLKGFTSTSAHSQHKKKEAKMMHVVFELFNS